MREVIFNVKTREKTLLARETKEGLIKIIDDLLNDQDDLVRVNDNLQKKAIGQNIIINNLTTDNVKLQERLDASLYAMVLMQSENRKWYLELQQIKSDRPL